MAEKPPNTYRIFVYGGSAAQGWPISDVSSVRILQSMLTERYPGVYFELNNMAFIAINSHLMLPIGEACAKMDPDLYIIYMGNNEFSGPFGLRSTLGFTQLPASVMKPLISLLVRMPNLRLWQIADSLTESQGLEATATGYGFPAISMEDPRIERTYTLYRANLERLCEAGYRGGANVALCTIGRNLKDWNQKYSEHRFDLSQEERDQWESLFQRGKYREEERDWQKALDPYQKAFAIDGTYSELAYRIARCYWNLESYDEAEKYFILAADSSRYFGSVTSRTNEIIVETGHALADKNVHLVDMARRFSERAPHGIPGAEFFCDCVHLNFEGNYEIASALFETISGFLPGWVKEKAQGTPATPSIEECEQWLNYTPERRLSDVEEELTRQADDKEAVERLEALKEQLKRQVEAQETPPPPAAPESPAPPQTPPPA